MELKVYKMWRLNEKCPTGFMLILNGIESFMKFYLNDFLAPKELILNGIERSPPVNLLNLSISSLILNGIERCL